MDNNFEMEFYKTYELIGNYIVNIETNEKIRDESINNLEISEQLLKKIRGTFAFKYISSLVLASNKLLYYYGFDDSEIYEIIKSINKFLGTQILEESNKDVISNNEETLTEAENVELNENINEQATSSHLESTQSFENNDQNLFEQEEIENEFGINTNSFEVEDFDFLNEFSTRTRNVLRRYFVKNSKDFIAFVEQNDLTQIRNLGTKSIDEILEKYNNLKVSFVEEPPISLSVDIRNTYIKEIKEIDILSTKSYIFSESFINLKGTKFGIRNENIEKIDFELSIAKYLREFGIEKMEDFIKNIFDEEACINDEYLLDIKEKYTKYVSKNIIKLIVKNNEIIRDPNDELLTINPRTNKLFLNLDEVNLLNELTYISNGNNFRIRDTLYEINNFNLTNFDLSVRLKNVLLNNNLEYFSDILVIGFDALKELRNCGKKSIEEFLSLIETYIINNSVLLKRIDDDVYQSILNDASCEKELLNLLKDKKFNGLERVELINILSEKYDNSLIVNTIDKCLEDKKIFVYEGDKLFYRFMSFPQFLYNMEPGKIKDALYSKLDGETLEEIAARYNVTRERIRQIIAKYINNTLFHNTKRVLLFREDRFEHIYTTYNFVNVNFSEVFGEKDRTKNYLQLVYGYSGEKDIKDALDDDEITPRLKSCINKYLNKNKLIINGRTIPKHKINLINEYARENLQDEKRIPDAYEEYKDFLRKYDLSEEKYCTDSSRAFGAILDRCSVLLTGPHQSYRYYNLKDYNFEELLNELDLESYDDFEVSTKLLFENHSDLMVKYELRNFYELHNLLKRIIPEDHEKIHFGRTPILQIGNVDRTAYIKSLIDRYDSINCTELSKVIESETGVPANIANAVWVNAYPKDENYANGVFTHKATKKLSDEEYRFFKDNLTEDFYFIKDVKKMFIETFGYFDESLINIRSMLELGYTLYSKYILKKPLTAVKYAELKSSSIFNIKKDRMRSLSMFSQYLYDLRANLDVIEFEPFTYISFKKLEEAGITKADLNDFAQQAISFSNGEYFSIKSLREKGFVHKLDDLGFSEKFYENIIHYGLKTPMFRINDTGIFKDTCGNISFNKLCIEIIYKFERIDTYELIDYLKKNYYIDVNSDKLNDLKYGDFDIYYDNIMDAFYKDYNTYYEEI